MNSLVGKKAPDFTLYASDKSKISLQDYKGQNVLLVFFPLAFTGVCTKEVCDITDNLQTYNASNSAVLGISVDSLFTLAVFKEQQKVGFPLLSDFNKMVSKDYEVLYDTFPAFEMEGVSKRAVVIIDKNQIVQYVEVCPTPGDMPDFNKVQEVLATL